MRESDTYQEILEEGEARGVAQGVAQGLAQGREEEVRSLILRIASRKVGPPGSWIVSRLESINDIAVLEAMIDRLFDGTVASWGDLIPPVA